MKFLTIGEVKRIFWAGMCDEVIKRMLSADREPQSVFIARVLDEDFGWKNVRIEAVNEDEVRAQLDGVVSVHQIVVC